MEIDFDCLGTVNYKGRIMQYCQLAKILFLKSEDITFEQKNEQFKCKILFLSNTYESEYFPKKKTAESHSFYRIMKYLQLSMLTTTDNKNVPSIYDDSLSHSKLSEILNTTSSIPHCTNDDDNCIHIQSAINKAKFTDFFESVTPIFNEKISYKAKLYEFCQIYKFPFPLYSFKNTGFMFQCELIFEPIPGLLLISKETATKKAAENHVSYLLIQHLFREDLWMDHSSESVEKKVPLPLRLIDDSSLAADSTVTSSSSSSFTFTGTSMDQSTVAKLARYSFESTRLHGVDTASSASTSSSRIKNDYTNTLTTENVPFVCTLEFLNANYKGKLLAYCQSVGLPFPTISTEKINSMSNDSKSTGAVTLTTKSQVKAHLVIPQSNPFQFSLFASPTGNSAVVSNELSLFDRLARGDFSESAPKYYSEMNSLQLTDSSLSPPPGLEIGPQKVNTQDNENMHIDDTEVGFQCRVSWQQSEMIGNLKSVFLSQVFARKKHAEAHGCHLAYTYISLHGQTIQTKSDSLLLMNTDESASLDEVQADLAGLKVDITSSSNSGR